jgi:hypothetical protein
VNALRSFNVHTIAIQIPIARLTRDGSKPSDPLGTNATIGLWASAHRQKALVRDSGKDVSVGPFVQVSRLGNPLFNEVIVPMGRKDEWNTDTPDGDSSYAVRRAARAREAAARPLPGRVPEPHGVQGRPGGPARDPAHRHPEGNHLGFQNFTGPTQADMLRLNVAIPPSGSPGTRTGSWAATWPASQTAGGCSTTS